MKTLLTRSCAVLLLISIAWSCKDPEGRQCRISKFYYEGEWHRAYYTPEGRLLSLIADKSKIIFKYDELLRLKGAQIFMNGDPNPYYRYSYIQGPNGIVQIDEYYPYTMGTFIHNRFLFHYSSPGVVDYFIRQEWGNTEDLGFEIRYDITYSGGNVKHIDGTSSVITTDYYGIKYDKNHNPFKALAALVGNDAFFPVGIKANYPVSNYDISMLSLFSRNNPLAGQYRIPGVDPVNQVFVYGFNGDIVETIGWESTSYSTSVEKYAFGYECGPLTITEH